MSRAFRLAALVIAVSVIAVGTRRIHLVNEVDFISAFTEQEVRSAIGLLTSPSDAARIAADIYAIPMAERSDYAWTDTAIDLLAASSQAVRLKVQTLWGGTVEEYEQRARAFHEFRAAGHISEDADVGDFLLKE